MTMKPEPEGRWARLESIVKTVGNEHRPPQRQSLRRHARRRKSSSWVVIFPGLPSVGSKVAIRTQRGALQHGYVQAVIIPGDRRADGCSVLAVSKSPVQRQAAAEAKAAVPPPPAPPVLSTRNPRVCSECEGPCRVGAGMCEECKAAAAALENTTL